MFIFLATIVVAALSALLLAPLARWSLCFSLARGDEEKRVERAKARAKESSSEKENATVAILSSGDHVGPDAPDDDVEPVPLGDQLSDKRRSAFHRMAMGISILGGSHWVGSMLRSPIFQAHIGVVAEGPAKLHTVWISCVCTIAYTLALRRCSPRLTVYLVCAIFGGYLILVAVYLGVIDLLGGPGDGLDGEVKKRLAKSFQPLFARDVRKWAVWLLYFSMSIGNSLGLSMCWSFIQVYADKHEKSLNLVVFSFLNVWEHAGTFMMTLASKSCHNKCF